MFFHYVTFIIYEMFDWYTLYNDCPDSAVSRKPDFLAFLNNHSFYFFPGSISSSQKIGDVMAKLAPIFILLFSWFQV